MPVHKVQVTGQSLHVLVSSNLPSSQTQTPALIEKGSSQVKQLA